MSHEAIYTWLYAMPNKTLREHGILLRSKRTSRTPRRKLGQRGAPIVGMVSIDDRPEDVAGRRVPGHWEGDLIIGAHGKTAVITLVERTTRLGLHPGAAQGQGRRRRLRRTDRTRHRPPRSDEPHPCT